MSEQVQSEQADLKSNNRTAEHDPHLLGGDVITLNLSHHGLDQRTQGYL